MIQDTLSWLFHYHNVLRKLEKKTILSIDYRLNAAAQDHANVMAAQKRMFHTLDIDKKIQAFGFTNSWNHIGENVAFHSLLESTEKLARSTMEQWLLSKTHKANILHPDFREIGLGMTIDSDGIAYFCVIMVR